MPLPYTPSRWHDGLGENSEVNAMARLVAFVLLLSLLALPAWGKDKEPYVWERVNEVDLTQQEIITYAHVYLAEKFVSSKDFIQLNDPALGKLVGTVILRNKDARLLHAFHGIRGRLIIDAKDGRYRIQMTNIVGTDSDGQPHSWGQIEGANNYRIQPMAESVLDDFSNELTSFLASAKANEDW